MGFFHEKIPFAGDVCRDSGPIDMGADLSIRRNTARDHSGSAVTVSQGRSHIDSGYQ
jgi:hypothetical protein